MKNSKLTPCNGKLLMLATSAAPSVRTTTTIAPRPVASTRRSRSRAQVALQSLPRAPLPSLKRPPTRSNAPKHHCRFMFVRVVVLKVLELADAGKETIRRILRKGKELVARSYIANTNERNEYGRCMVRRRHPFRSSSSDVGQAMFQCNFDLQFMDGAVPEDDPLEPAAPEPSAANDDAQQDERAADDLSRFLCGFRNKMSQYKMKILSLFAMRMRAAHIVDFYMTKYQAKPQQALAPAMSTIAKGLRRQEEEAEARADESDAPQQQQVALSKLRRIIFSANRCHWYSQCEIAIFIMTKGHTICTHATTPIFTARLRYMAEECKRLLNEQKDHTRPDDATAGDPAPSSSIFIATAASVSAAVSDIVADAPAQPAHATTERANDPSLEPIAASRPASDTARIASEGSTLLEAHSSDAAGAAVHRRSKERGPLR